MVPLPEVWRVLRRLSLGQIWMLVLVNGLVLVSMSGRWWLILRGQGYGVPYLTLVGYRLAAFGVSYFTPGPQFGGEPLQVYLVGRHHGVPNSTGIAAVTLDKLLELLVNFSFLVAGLVLVMQQQIFSRSIGSLLTAFGLGLLALPVLMLVTLGSGRTPFSSLFRLTDRIILHKFQRQSLARVAGYQKAVGIVLTSERQASRFCRQQPGTLVLALLVSLLSWGLLVLEYWLALYFLGATLTPVQTIIALTAARVAILLPLPGGLGTLEASQVLAMQLLGFDPAIGLSLSVLIRVRDVLLGGLGLWWGGLKS